jgi:hypothetical protein
MIMIMIFDYCFEIFSIIIEHLINIIFPYISSPIPKYYNINFPKYIKLYFFIINVWLFFFKISGIINLDQIKGIITKYKILKAYFGIFLFYISFGCFQSYILFHSLSPWLNEERISFFPINRLLTINNVKNNSEYYLLLVYIPMTIKFSNMLLSSNGKVDYFINFLYFVYSFLSIFYHNYGEIMFITGINLFMGAFDYISDGFSPSSSIPPSHDFGEAKNMIREANHEENHSGNIAVVLLRFHWLYCWLNNYVSTYPKQQFSCYMLKIGFANSIFYLFLKKIFSYPREIHFFLGSFKILYDYYKKNIIKVGPYTITNKTNEEEKKKNASNTVNIVVSDLKCNLCLDNPKDVICKPCNHLCLCEDCSKSLAERGEFKNCMICTQKITHVEKIYLS